MITASQLTRFCGYSRVLGKTRKRSKAQQAAMDRGTLFHEIAAAHGTGQTYKHDDDDVNEWIERMFSNGRMTGLGERWEWAIGVTAEGRGVECDEPEPHAYVAKDGSPLLTAGRADWVALDKENNLAVVRDFKTGKSLTEPAYRNPQVLSLGFAAASLFGADGFVPQIYYARDGHLDSGEPVRFDTEASDEAWADVVRMATMDETPRPGSWCDSCWEKKECKFREKYGQSQTIPF